MSEEVVEQMDVEGNWLPPEVTDEILLCSSLNSEKIEMNPCIG